MEKKYNKLRITVQETVAHNYDFEIPDSIEFEDSRIEEIRKIVVDEFKESKRLLNQPWQSITSTITLTDNRGDGVESFQSSHYDYSNESINTRFMGRLDEKEGKNTSIETPSPIVSRWKVELDKTGNPVNYLCTKCGHKIDATTARAMDLSLYNKCPYCKE